jgi:hypothetical protein
MSEGKRDNETDRKKERVIASKDMGKESAGNT